MERTNKYPLLGQENFTPIQIKNIEVHENFLENFKSGTNILSRASEAGFPTNRPGSDKTRGQGSFGPSTGGPDLKERIAHLIRLIFTKTG